MAEHFVLLCLVAIAQGITTPRDPWAQESRQGTKSITPLKDNLQMASSTDQKEAATGHGHGHDFHGGLGHGHGNGYFQYAHNPDYGHYEFGYRRGNDYHFQERYEKAHDWKFKTKVKWGDKYGGYGEHYYDYNHVDKGYGGDHGHGGGGGGGYDGGHGHGHYSEQVPVVSEPDERNKNNRVVQKRESKGKQNRRALKGEESKLSLDPVTGQVTDENTGRTYWLQPTTEKV